MLPAITTRQHYLTSALLSYITTVLFSLELGRMERPLYILSGAGGVLEDGKSYTIQEQCYYLFALESSHNENIALSSPGRYST